MLQDIVDHVVDFLHDDTNALKSCTLVSSSWDRPASYHLFASLRLNPRQLMAPPGQPDKLQPVYVVLKDLPRITASVKKLALSRTDDSSGKGWKGHTSGHELDILPYVCLDIFGDIISLFPRLRTLDLTWEFAMAPSAKSWLPNITLTRPAPIDIASLSMRVAIQDGWLQYHRSMLAYFKSIKTLKLDLVTGPLNHTSDHAQPLGQDQGSEIRPRINGLQLNMNRDDERSLYLYEHFPKLLDFSDVTSLIVYGQLFAPRVQHKFQAILGYTRTLTHLAIDFSDDLWNCGSSSGRTDNCFDISGLQHGLSCLHALRSVYIKFELYYDSVTDIYAKDEGPQHETFKRNDHILSSCVAFASIPPSLSRVRITLPNWSFCWCRFQETPEPAFAAMRALSWRPLDVLRRRQPLLEVIELRQPFRENNWQGLCDRAEDTIRNKLSEDVRGLVRFCV